MAATSCSTCSWVSPAPKTARVDSGRPPSIRTSSSLATMPPGRPSGPLPSAARNASAAAVPAAGAGLAGAAAPGHGGAPGIGRACLGAPQAAVAEAGVGQAVAERVGDRPVRGGVAAVAGEHPLAVPDVAFLAGEVQVG